jgi:hypothetical protein
LGFLFENKPCGNPAYDLLNTKWLSQAHKIWHVWKLTCCSKLSTTLVKNSWGAMFSNCSPGGASRVLCAISAFNRPCISRQSARSFIQFNQW